MRAYYIKDDSQCKGFYGPCLNPVLDSAQAIAWPGGSLDERTGPEAKAVVSKRALTVHYNIVFRATDSDVIEWKNSILTSMPSASSDSNLPRVYVDVQKGSLHISNASLSDSHSYHCSLNGIRVLSTRLLGNYFPTATF